MRKSVTFYYDYGSPNCYLAWTQISRICERAGASLIRRPILLGGIFKAVGNNSPIEIQAKATWMFEDIARFAGYYGVPFMKPDAFPFNSIAAMRAAIWAAQSNGLAAFDEALFRGAWVEGLDIGDPKVVHELGIKSGLNGAALREAISTPDVKAKLMSATAEAVTVGAFGAPTFVVDGALHFGQDRLPWIERALTAAP